MRYRRSVVAALLCIGVALLVAGTVCAQGFGLLFRDPPGYPWRGDPNDFPQIVTLKNSYIACLVGKGGQVLTHHLYDDDSDGRMDKWGSVPENKWRCNGRYSVGTVQGDPETTEDDNMPITFMANAPCHYFAYWKLKIGNDMRMIGDGASGGWYSEANGQPPYNPTLYESPPPDMLKKEPTLGVTGPFIRGIWRTTGGNGSEIRTEIRIHLVRDMVRFEYRITNNGTVTENVGFSQNGDVEVGDAILTYSDDGGAYGPFDNRNYAFLPGTGATVPVNKQAAFQFGFPGTPPVPNWFEVYDDVQNPINVTRNVLGLEDATKPDYVAIGDYNDLFHKDMWLPRDYKPDPLHIITDMTWVLCWDQKPLAPNITRTIVTYYGLAAATSRWTYRLGSRSVRDSAVLAVQAPKSVRYDSTIGIPDAPEISPNSFSVTAHIYDLATDPGPNDLRDATATISLPPGLRLVSGESARKSVEMIGLNSESEPIVWQVEATGEYCGELPIYVSVVDNDPSGKYWQQSVTRNIFVPAVKRGQFTYGWQLMHVPFNFSDPYFHPEIFPYNPFGLPPGNFGAKYYDVESKVYKPVKQLRPGQAFWMFVEGLSWKQTQPFFLSDAMIVGEALGTGKQALEQRIVLARGWNMIGNPFVYPVYWGQVLVYLYGYDTVTLDDAVSLRLMDKTLFSWNTSKWDYDITSDKSTLLNPWKGYWVNAKQPVTLIFRPPVVPGGDVTANPGGN